MCRRGGPGCRRLAGRHPVYLVQVDVIGAQAAQALLARPDDPAPRRTAFVEAGSHRARHFCGQDDIVTPCRDCLPDDDLGLALRSNVFMRVPF
jgi:hypothetical protein